jgi:hypothetical protein
MTGGAGGVKGAASGVIVDEATVSGGGGGGVEGDVKVSEAGMAAGLAESVDGFFSSEKDL